MEGVSGSFPSLDKEGWREAPGWFDALPYTTPPPAAAPLLKMRRGEISLIPSFLRRGGCEAAGVVRARPFTTPPPAAAPLLKRGGETR